MTKEEAVKQIVATLNESGLSHEECSLALSLARLQVKKRVGLEEWRDNRKPLTKPGERKK